MAMAVAMAMTLVWMVRWDDRRYPSECCAQFLKSPNERLVVLAVLSRCCCDGALVPKLMTMRAEVIPQAALVQRPVVATQRGNLERLGLALCRLLASSLEPLPRPLLQFLQLG